MGDYCSLQGHNYVVLADRYSGWLSIFKTGKEDLDGPAMVKILREYFCTFGVAEEFSSDMGPKMMSDVVQNQLTENLHPERYYLIKLSHDCCRKNRVNICIRNMDFSYTK